MSADNLPLNAEQIAVVREVFGDDIAHHSDAHIALAVDQSTFERIAEGNITPEHVAGAMAHLNEAQDLSFKEMRVLDTAAALSDAMDALQAGSPRAEITLEGEFVDYKQEIDAGALVSAVESHLVVMQEFNQDIGIAREVLGDAVANMTDVQLAESLGPAGLSAVTEGRIDFDQALAAQASIAEQLNVEPEQVGLADAVSTLVRAQEDLATDSVFGVVHTSIEVPAADGFSDQVTAMVDSADLVAAVEGRGELAAPEATAEHDASHQPAEAESSAEMAM